MATIHPTAIVDPRAHIASDVVVGPFTTIEGDVTIGAGTSIGPHVRIDNGARIGANVTIHQGAAVSTPPQDLKYRNEPTELFIGDGTELREYCMLNRGTTHSMKTVVGKNCYIMAYAHVAHDCRVGDNVIIANAAQMGGHTEIGDFAILGGLVGIHQFTHIGMHCMVAAGIRVVKDIPPYALAGGFPAKFEGINSIGLRRRGFAREAIDAIEEAYKAIYHSGLNVSQGVERIKSTMTITPEVQNILDFIAQSNRGIQKSAI
ncbi:MAG: acyl-ACP--UDP-N-acetylglucosamine O-acyltransferase [Ignavibacteria bacterium]|nr:acyl-ACP--UDP-N-acetylglucosamine O-acyltransferase [Ignavibacteria bacterium]